MDKPKSRSVPQKEEVAWGREERERWLLFIPCMFLQMAMTTKSSKSVSVCVCVFVSVRWLVSCRLCSWRGLVLSRLAVPLVAVDLGGHNGAEDVKKTIKGQCLIQSECLFLVAFMAAQSLTSSLLTIDSSYTCPTSGRGELIMPRDFSERDSQRAGLDCLVRA